MKTSNRNNDKKVNLNKDPRGGARFSRLNANMTQLCLLGAVGWFSRLERLFDGLNANHNEMFLADRS